jgi:hypothetical protein
MKAPKFYLLLLLCSVLNFSCKKENEGWDVRLNGKWTEDTPSNAKSLPLGCDLLFNDNYLEICNQSLTEDVNKKSGVYSENGQIYLQYNLGLKHHTEFRYDYQFEGDFLWLMEETTEKKMSVANISGAKKYRKI